MASKKDANGNTETYNYDAYQRLISIPDRQQTFTYDTLCTPGVLGCVNAPGQLLQATFGSNVGPDGLSFAYDYTYTPAGKVSSKTMVVMSSWYWADAGGDPASASLAINYTYDNQGVLTSSGFPASSSAYYDGAAVFTNTLDAMERPTAMVDNAFHPYTWVTGVTYNPANQMLFDGVRTWSYNNLLQATSVTGTGMSMTYNYSPNKNNGQITSSVDAGTTPNETITYTYDALKRLIQADGLNWTENYVYDGFGNLTQMNPTGGAPTLSVSVALDQNNVPNNRITASGVSYDNNGNLTLGFGNIGPEYDAANRVSQVWMNGQPNTYYGYDPDNHRVYSGGTGHGADTIYLYGVDGKKLATYTTTFTGSYPLYKMQLNCQSDNVYFGGRLVSAEGNLVRTDRLGSVRSGGPGGLGYQAQYPYGVEYTTTANDREKYATYTRDSLTGFDYAVNRYYSSQWGRFLSPDPYMADSGGAGDLRDPGSWNRYAYALNEPVSLYDPAGLFACSGDGEDQYRFGGAACFAGAGGDGPPQRPMSDSDQPGGGGGGPSANIASRTPPALVSAFQRAFREAWSVLQTDPNCAGSLVNQPAESSAASYVTGVLADTTYRIMPFGLGMSAVGAQTNEDGSVFINQTGAFFTLQPNASGNVTFNIPSPTTGRWVAVTLPQVDFQAFIILHETGHETGVFGPDQNPVVNGQHSWDVLENCFGLQAPTTLAPPPLSPHP